MNPVNFIKTVSPKQQVELQRWRKISTLVCILGFGAGLYVVAPLLMRLQELMSEKKTLSAYVQNIKPESFKKYEQLKQEITDLKKRQAKIALLEQRSRSTTGQLADIIGAAGKHAHVQSIKHDGKEIVVQLQCDTADTALTVLEKLEKSRFLTTVRLANLHYVSGTQSLQATIYARC